MQDSQPAQCAARRGRDGFGGRGAARLASVNASAGAGARLVARQCLLAVQVPPPSPCCFLPTYVLLGYFKTDAASLFRSLEKCCAARSTDDFSDSDMPPLCAEAEAERLFRCDGAMES